MSESQSQHIVPGRSSDHPLEDVLEAAVEQTEGDRVCVDDILQLYGRRSFGPVFILLGLVTVLPPIGGIPGVPTTIGLLLIMFSVQILFGEEEVWLPDFIAKRSISKDKICAAHRKSKRVLEIIDENIFERFVWASGPISTRFAALLVSFMGFLMFPMEFVPFMGLIPGLAVVFMGLGLFAKDGVILLGGYTLAFIALYIVCSLAPTGFSAVF